MCLQTKTLNFIGKAPYRSLTFIQECSFNGKIPFLWLANIGVKPPFFKVNRPILQKLLVRLAK